jgi:hypothetical protein
VDNVHGLSRLNSNSAERIVRRLKRDAPDIAEALARGEFKSARAAGIAAGIITPPTPLEPVAGPVGTCANAAAHHTDASAIPRSRDPGVMA